MFVKDTVSIKGIGKDIPIIDNSWIPYNSVSMKKNRSMRANQVRNLIFTGLTEGLDGGEARFLPLRSIFEAEQSILDSYDKIKTVDHQIELCNEVYYTSKIEGSKTTIARTIELHNGQPVSPDSYFSEMMVKQGFEATKFLNVHGNRLDMDILLGMWNILVEGCCSNESLRGDKFRIGPVKVGNHLGFSPDKIEDAIGDWIGFYNSDVMNDHPFIKASLLHMVYEKIHPFCDGNGRSGRLLATNYLIGVGLDKCKAVAFSKQIASTINQYDSALDESENGECDYTPFVNYMMSVYDNVLYDVLVEQQSQENDISVLNDVGKSKLSGFSKELASEVGIGISNKNNNQPLKRLKSESSSKKPNILS